MAKVGDVNVQFRYYGPRCKVDFSEIEALLREIDKNNPIKVRFRDTLATPAGNFVVCRIIKNDFADSYVCTNGVRTVVLNEMMLTYGDMLHFRDGQEIVHDCRALPPFTCKDNLFAEAQNFGKEAMSTKPFKPAYTRDRRSAKGGHTGLGDYSYKISTRPYYVAPQESNPPGAE